MTQGKAPSDKRTPIRPELLPLLAFALFMAFVAGTTASDLSLIHGILAGAASILLAVTYVLLAAGRGRW
jgi:hypothetical protein